MRYDDATAAEIMTIAGNQALLGSEPFYAVPLYPFEMEFGSGSMDTDQFALTIAFADIVRLSLTEGESGSVISYNGSDYRVLNIEDDDSGFATLHLGGA